MSLLYKDEKDVKYSVEVKTFPDGKINLLFSADCGKFGTDEILDEHELTIKELLQILQKSEQEQLNIPVVSKLFSATEDQAYMRLTKKYNHPFLNQIKNH